MSDADRLPYEDSRVAGERGGFVRLLKDRGHRPRPDQNRLDDSIWSRIHTESNNCVTSLKLAIMNSWKSMDDVKKTCKAFRSTLRAGDKDILSSATCGVVKIRDALCTSRVWSGPC